MDATDPELLRLYHESRSEEAFAELVRRHVSLVYGVAVRKTGGDVHLAEDVTQGVFIALARSAPRLARRDNLTGWLFTTARYVGTTVMRGERRRQAREQQEFLMHDQLRETAPRDGGWNQIRPEIDSALEELNERDRIAVLLRFFEGLSFGAIGQCLQVTEDAARMRVERALEKLRFVLGRRGVNSTAGALAGVLATHAASGAPTGLVSSITGVVLAHATASGTLAATLMSIPKLSLGVAGILGLAGTLGFVSQARTNAALAGELSALRAQNQDIPARMEENQGLARTAAEVAELRGDDAELKRLAEKSSELLGRLKTVAAVRARDEPDGLLDGQPVYAIGKLDLKPLLKSGNRQLGHPPGMREVKGAVTAEFIIDAAGNVRNARVISATHPEFAAATIEHLGQLKYAPGEKYNRTVNAQVRMTTVFQPSEKRGGP